MNNEQPPLRITLLRAYKGIYKWYKASKDMLERSEVFKEYYGANRQRDLITLIDNLPNPKVASKLEMRAILIEVKRGSLEPCFQDSDGSYRMGDYAEIGLKSLENKNLRDASVFTEKELAVLTESKLWPYLTYSKST